MMIMKVSVYYFQGWTKNNNKKIKSKFNIFMENRQKKYCEIYVYAI